MRTDNLLLLTDSYKISHAKQYPPGTEHVFSFFESRGSQWPDSGGIAVLFFGLQYILRRHFGDGPAFDKEDIEEADAVCRQHFGSDRFFNREGWEYILREHGGRLPVEIRAVPEGTLVPVRNVMMTMVNTDPKVPWLTNYLETILSQVWYPCTVATKSWDLRWFINKRLELTGDPSLVDFKLHDFGCRGSTSMESAAIGGAAHLVSFKGSDTMPALRLLRDYYDEPMAGFSIPAAEHSTITSWGREREVDAYRNMLEQYPTGIVAVVSDSYDVFNACKNIWGSALRDKVIARDGVLVVRPDSGEPRRVVLKVLDILGHAFGVTTNAKGYKLLDPHVRVIQGDGVNEHTVREILDDMEANCWSADNITFGSGGALLQKMDRDTFKFAIKCSAVQINGEWHPVQKDPITDPGKKSKAGRLDLLVQGDRFVTVDRDAADTLGVKDPSALQLVFQNGSIMRHQTLADVRGMLPL